MQLTQFCECSDVLQCTYDEHDDSLNLAPMSKKWDRGCNVESSGLEAGYCKGQSEHCCFELHVGRFKERDSRRRKGQMM